MHAVEYIDLVYSVAPDKQYIDKTGNFIVQISDKMISFVYSHEMGEVRCDFVDNERFSTIIRENTLFVRRYPNEISRDDLLTLIEENQTNIVRLVMFMLRDNEEAFVDERVQPSK